MSDKKRFAVGAHVRVKNPGVNGVVTQGDEEPTVLGQYWHTIQTEHGQRKEPGCNLELVPTPMTNSEAGVLRPDRFGEPKFPDLGAGLLRMLAPKSAGTESPGEQVIRIFISHSHADVAIAEAFADLFRSAFNLPCDTIRCSSVPRYSLQFGVEVPRQIRAEVLAASVLIGIVTASSRESAWVLFELGAR